MSPGVRGKILFFPLLTPTQRVLLVHGFWPTLFQDPSYPMTNETVAHPSTSAIRGKGLFLSLLLVAALVVQSSWFFAAMCIMAGAMVVAGTRGHWGDWFVWVGMLAAFALFAELRARMGPAVEARTLYLYAIQLETLWGLLPVSCVWLQETVQGEVLDALATAVYLSFFIVPQLVVVYLWRTGGPFGRYVAAACFLFSVALLVHFFLPTAPPWMAGEEGYFLTLDRIGIRVLTATYPGLTAGGYQASANDVAAMPSVHQGLTVLAMIAMANHVPSSRWTAWAYSLSMLFAIAYLGEHYVVDGLAGAGVAWAGWWISGRRPALAGIP